MQTYIDPFTDFGFKRIFGSEESKPLLISFLNDIPEAFRNDIIESHLQIQPPQPK